MRSKDSHNFYKHLKHRAHKMRLRYLKWQNKHLSEGVVLILIAFVVGILTGVAAAVLKLLVKFFNHLLLYKIHFDKPDYRLLIFPVIGILLTSVYKRYVVRENITTGTSLIKNRLVRQNYRFPIFDIFNPILGCSLTMGFGASAGTEGPTALSGASIGSCVGRWFGLSSSWLRLLVGIGAGAGIAAIFKAPIGGALFSIEVLQMEMTTLPIVALIFSCLIASSTAYLLSNFTFDISFVRDMPMEPKTLGWVLLLGVFCGLYSIYYNYTKNRGSKLFRKIQNPWIGALSTGAVLSVAAFLFPVLFGEGFSVITGLVNGRYVSFTDSGIFSGHSGAFWLWGSLLAVLLLKGFLVAASYSNGGIAGDFVPTFFAGALAGALFAMIVNNFFNADLPIWYFALIGMGCVMAGAIHAPLMAIFILCETTNTYAYIFPYLLAISISYAIVKIITPKAWYSETGSDDVLALLKLRQTPSLRFKSSGQIKQSEDSAGANVSSKTSDNMPQGQK